MEKQQQIIALAQNIIDNNDDKLSPSFGFHSMVLDAQFNRETFGALANGELTQGMNATELDELIDEIQAVVRKLDASSFLRPNMKKWISCIREYCNFDMEEYRNLNIKQASGQTLSDDEKAILGKFTTKKSYVETFEKMLDILDRESKLEASKAEYNSYDDEQKKSPAGEALAESIKARELDLPTASKTAGKTVKFLVEFVTNVTEEQFTVSKFNNKVVFSVHLQSTDGSPYEINSTSALAFTEQFTSLLPQNLKTPISHIAQTLVELYDIGNRGDYLTPFNNDDTNEYVERFAEHIDSQVGNGGFAAYMLYPLLYNDPEVRKNLGIRRHILVGTMASTGKTILGRFLKLFYKDLPFDISTRQETTGKGYTGGKNRWNEQIIGKSIVYIDDDTADNVDVIDRADFYKNLWGKNGLTVGASGKETNATFTGYCYSNANRFDASLSTQEQVSKRVYIFMLNKLFKDSFAPTESSIFYNMGTPSSPITRDSVINYLNEHIDDAINWLVNYTQPKDVANAGIGEGTSEYDLIVLILKLIAKVTADNKEGVTPWVPLNHIKDVFGGYVDSKKITGKSIAELGNGKYFKSGTSLIAQKRVTVDGAMETLYLVGKHPGAETIYCITLQPDVTLDDFDNLTDKDRQDLTKLFDEANNEAAQNEAAGGAGSQSMLTPDKIQAVLSVNMATDEDAAFEIIKSVISTVSTNEKMMNELKSLINNDITTTK